MLCDPSSEDLWLAVAQLLRLQCHLKIVCLEEIEDMKSDANILDEPTPIGVQLSPKYKRSYAYVTVNTRLPVILTKVIDHLSRSKEDIALNYGEDSREDLKVVVGSFSRLKNELQTDKPLQVITTDGDDVELWNCYLQEQQERLGVTPTWYNTTWLYVECYMYRRVREIFELSQTLRDFDPFRHSKEELLHEAQSSLKAFSDHLLVELESVPFRGKEENIASFKKIVHVNLWSNRFDLSSVSLDNSMHLESPLDWAEKFCGDILVDDTDRMWDILTKADEGGGKIVDIVMDNAGFELFTDLCLADFLCSLGLANKIRFYVKAMPWFMSDTMIQDFDWMLNHLLDSPDDSVQHLGSRWRNYLDSGTWKVVVHQFWTLPHGFHHMREVDPALYKQLSQARLLVFKGDLNYRKLLDDVNYDATFPFNQALQGFGPTNLVSLRTVKCDLICGLREGLAEDLSARSSDWQLTGQFGLVQFSHRLSKNCKCHFKE